MFSKKPRIIIVLILPFLLFIFLGFFLYDDFKQYIKEICNLGLLYLISACLTFFFKNQNYRKFVFFITLFLLSLVVFIKLSFINYYGARINASAIHIISETNTNEAFDFILTYLSKKNWLILIPAFFSFILFLLKKPFTPFINIFKENYFKIVFILTITFCIYQINLRFYNENLFYRFYSGIEGYHNYKKGLKNALSKKTSNYIKLAEVDSNNQTHIVVIGESTTKTHMELYGYYRDTNPILSSHKSELNIFNNTISPHTHTIASLEKILTLSSFENENLTENFSIVQLANAANYETFWLSMQEPLGLTETLPTIISHAADHAYFLETKNWNEKIHDEKIFTKLNEILNFEYKKKLIFIHLMGTHVDYKKRYPEKFSFYDDKVPKSNFKSRNSLKTINYYDNAVRYNDFIVSEILKTLKNKNEVSSMTYFSDHGQEVYNTLDYMGHDEYNPTKPMYEVPFIIWFSQKYIEKNVSKLSFNNLSKKYILEDFPFTFADIIQSKFLNYTSNKSIINSDFKEKIRIIRNNKDYDKIKLP